MFSIGEMAKICGTTIKTIRYYSDVKLVVPLQINNENGYRYYSYENVEKYYLIKELRDFEFTIEEITNINLKTGTKGLIVALEKKRDELARKIDILKEKETKLNRIIDGFKTQENSLLNQVFIKEIPKRTVVFYREKTSYDGNFFIKGIEKLDNLVKEENLVTDKVILALYNSFSDKDIDIEFCYETHEKGKKVYLKTVPKGKYLSYIHKGDYISLRTEAYTAVYDYIENNGIEIDDFSVELYYVTRPITQNPQEFITEIQFPIKNKIFY